MIIKYNDGRISSEHTSAHYKILSTLLWIWKFVDLPGSGGAEGENSPPQHTHTGPAQWKPWAWEYGWNTISLPDIKISLTQTLIPHLVGESHVLPKIPGMFPREVHSSMLTFASAAWHCRILGLYDLYCYWTTFFHLSPAGRPHVALSHSSDFHAGRKHQPSCTRHSSV